MCNGNKSIYCVHRVHLNEVQCRQEFSAAALRYEVLLWPLPGRRTSRQIRREHAQPLARRCGERAQRCCGTVRAVPATETHSVTANAQQGRASKTVSELRLRIGSRLTGISIRRDD